MLVQETTGVGSRHVLHHKKELAVRIAHFQERDNAAMVEGVRSGKRF
jgi:hypothetical protein